MIVDERPRTKYTNIPPIYQTPDKSRHEELLALLKCKKVEKEQVGIYLPIRLMIFVRKFCKEHKTSISGLIYEILEREFKGEY